MSCPGFRAHASYNKSAVIIRAGGDELLLIQQIDHAALAERLIAAWQPGDFNESPRRDEILFATRRHDDGWIDEDAAPLVDSETGGLLDYVHAPDDIRRGIWPRGVERLSAFPYPAALVAQHALHLFDKYRTDPEWAAFFDRMERLRAANLGAAASRTEEELRRDYFFVRMADLLSLQFCDDWREPQRFGEFESHWDGSRLTITPDPFGGATVSMTITARRLPNIRFDARAAADAFADAPPLTISGIAAGAAAR
jgi:hypothetical protein